MCDGSCFLTLLQTSHDIELIFLLQLHMTFDLFCVSVLILNHVGPQNAQMYTLEFPCSTFMVLKSWNGLNGTLWFSKLKRPVLLLTSGAHFLFLSYSFNYSHIRLYFYFYSLYQCTSKNYELKFTTYPPLISSVMGVLPDSSIICLHLLLF